MPTNIFEKITTLILNNLEIKVKYVALDGTGFTSDNADKAYDTEKIRECINKEIKASDQIPLKSNFRHGWYRRLSQKTFNKEIYSLRNNVESVFGVIKRKLNGNNKSKSTRLQNKETRLKTTIYNILQSIKIEK